MGVRRVQRCTTPELKAQLLDPAGGKWFRPHHPYNDVFPGILLGDADTALSTNLLKEIGVTHVLNAAQGHNNSVYDGYVSTTANYYAKKGIKYLGIPAADMPGFYLRPYFHQAANFIADALGEGGKVLVHCQCGVSRSAALVAAFLMLKRGMTVQAALATIKSKRSIFPNQGFLSQLCDLDYELRRSGDVADTAELRVMTPPSRDLSPGRNPSAYPRFALIPSRALETFTNTRNYLGRASSVDNLAPRRATSVERLASPVREIQKPSSPRRARSLSPVPYTRSSSVPYVSLDYDDDDDIPTVYEKPMSPKVFDTYMRYIRSPTTPLPTTTSYVTREARAYDPYYTPRSVYYEIYRYPRTHVYDRYYHSLPMYHYINNLSKFYDDYKYARSSSPFLATGTSYIPHILYRPYYDYSPLKSYLTGYSYVPPYPYTEKYFSPYSKYPATKRIINIASLSPRTTIRA